MRIVFLGTSHGVPEPHRRCSSIMVEIGENRYIIDMGTQIIERLKTANKPVESIKGVFITHMHGDHSNGLVSFFDLCSWHFKNADPAIFLPGQAEEAMAAIDAWIRCNGQTPRKFNVNKVKEGVIFDDGTVKMTAYQTKHTSDSYSYLLEAEEKRVLFGGDLSYKGPQEDFPVSVFDSPVDLAICEAAHFHATAYLPLLDDCRNLRQLCFTHYYTPRIPSMYEMKKILPIPVTIATDDMEIII